VSAIHHVHYNNELLQYYTAGLNADMHLHNSNTYCYYSVISMCRRERQAYYKRREQAISLPEEFTSVIVDGMDQVM